MTAWRIVRFFTPSLVWLVLYPFTFRIYAAYRQPELPFRWERYFTDYTWVTGNPYLQMMLLLVPVAYYLTMLQVDAVRRRHGALPHRGRLMAGRPGSRLDAFAEFVFSRRTYEFVLQPALADLQHEYFEALSAGRTRKAQWVRLRGYVRFWSHVVAQVPVSVLRAAVKLWFSIP